MFTSHWSFEYVGAPASVSKPWECQLSVDTSLLAPSAQAFLAGRTTGRRHADDADHRRPRAVLGGTYIARVVLSIYTNGAVSLIS